MTDEVVFVVFDPVVVETQELNVVPFSVGDIFEEGDSTFAYSFFGASGEDMINVEGSVVTEPANNAFAPEFGDSGFPGRSVPVVGAVSRKLFGSFRVFFVPFQNIVTLPKVVAGFAVSSLYKAWLFKAFNAGFSVVHIENPITRGRVGA